MKKSKVFSIFLLMTILIVPLMAMATMVTAADKPKYCGVNEGQVITWNTEFDDGPLEDYIEDRFGEHLTNIQMDAYLEALWDPLEYDDDVVAWRVTIEDIEKEKDKDYDGEHFDENDVDYVRLEISIYETEDKMDLDAWEAVDRIEKFNLFDDEEKVYADFLREGADDQGMGLYYYSPNGDYIADLAAPGVTPMEPEWPMFFIPKSLDFDDVVDEVEELTEREIPAIDDYYSVGTEDINYFFQDKDVGFDTNLEYIPGSYTYVSKPEDFDSTIKFTDDGIMYYYEWSYDGDTIAKFELDTIGGVYLIENWWWIALIAAGVGVLIIVIIILIKRKR